MHWILPLLQQSQDGQFGGADERGIGIQRQAVSHEGSIQVTLMMMGQPQVIGVARVIGYQAGCLVQVRQASRVLPSARAAVTRAEGSACRACVQAVMAVS